MALVPFRTESSGTTATSRSAIASSLDRLARRSGEMIDAIGGEIAATRQSRCDHY